MNITEVTTEGLRRELKVVVGADELERRLSARLDDLSGRVRIKGFRPGHVPKAHLRKVYGRSVMAEVVQQAVAETSREAISQRQERPAFADGGNVDRIIQNFHIGVSLNISSRNFARFFFIDSQRLGLAAVQLKRYLFEIKNNVGGVFHHPFNR